MTKLPIVRPRLFSIFSLKFMRLLVPNATLQRLILKYLWVKRTEGPLGWSSGPLRAASPLQAHVRPRGETPVRQPTPRKQVLRSAKPIASSCLPFLSATVMPCAVQKWIRQNVFPCQFHKNARPPLPLEFPVVIRSLQASSFRRKVTGPRATDCPRAGWVERPNAKLQRRVFMYL